MPRILLILVLVVAGELIFGLAFNVPRFFRPTMLQVFEISNTQLSDMFAVYGVAAMLAYFPGGPLADRFSARVLIAVSLLLTAAGGVYMATIPERLGMTLLYGYWGVTTILLFWAALIRATRDWGGNMSQGFAFGILDGGRGLVAASAAFAAVGILMFYLPADATLATPDERREGLQAVILFYSALTFAGGILAWIVIPTTSVSNRPAVNPFQGMLVVLRRPIVWAQAAIVFCAYCGYKGLDNYSIYAVQVLGFDEVEGARLASYGAWTRPLAAIVAGIMADRYTPIRSIAVMFVALFTTFLFWSLLGAGDSGTLLIYANFFLTYIFVFALRGVYFALLQENQTPTYLTGATVGLVSVVGYTPDIFFAPIGARILDANPGLVGFQNYFRFLAAIAVVGLLATAWTIWLRRPFSGELWPRENTRKDDARNKVR